MAQIRGGDKLIAKLKAISDSAKQARQVSVGFLEGATYENGASVALIAAIQEFGAPSRGVPPRPFLRNAIAEHRAEWPEVLQTALLASDYDAKKAFSIVGEYVVGNIKDSIINGQYAPLSPITIAKKGHDRPLIDTSHMLNSVAYKVE